MKAVNKLCRVSALVFSVAALVLFFVPFATIVFGGGNEVTLIASQLAIGSKITAAGSVVDMAKSADLLFCMILTLLAIIGGAMTFKSQGARYFAPAVSLVSAVYMLVVAASDPHSFVDTRPLPDFIGADGAQGVTDVVYSSFVPLICIALFVAAALYVAHLLLDDYIVVSQSKGKLTIPKRLIRFLRDYKSEIKKIVWPGPRDVVKNTVVVLVMCLIVGAFIWLLDLGLGKAIMLILGA